MTEVARLQVTIGANTRDLESGLRDANQQTNDFARRAGANIRRAAAAFAGGAITIGAAAANAAISWESSFADVRKTVNASDTELAALEQSLRDMATSEVLGGLSNAHAELAGIAALAGQLGVETSSIDEFTESIAALVVASNLSSEEAATFAARFANVTGFDIAEDIDNLADTIVTLGNNMAATEGDITTFATRLSTLSNFNWEVDDILAYSAAMASLGLSPELGSSNLIRTITDMTNAVANGTPDLEAFASAAGMAVDEFAELAQSDSAGAFNAFIEGLSNMDIDAQLQTLQELGITSSEQQRTLLTLASGFDVVTDATELSTAAWQGNGAAMEEAAAKANTTQGNINRLRNNLQELGITLGTNVLPGVNALVEGLTSLTDGDYGNAIAEITAGLAMAGGGLVGITPEELMPGVEAWANMGDLVGQAVDALGLRLQTTFFNIKQTVDAFFLDMQIAMLSGIANVINALPEQARNIPGLDIGIDALEITLDQAELERAYISMADTIGELMNNATGPTDFSDPFGLANYLTLPDTSEIVAQLDPSTLSTLQADVESQLTAAFQEGDGEAIEVLTTIAANLDMDTADIEAQAIGEIESTVSDASYSASAAVDITLSAASIDMTAVQGAISAAIASATAAVTSGIASNSVGNATTPIDGPFHTGVSYYQAPPGQTEGIAVLREGEAVLTPGQIRSRGQESSRGDNVTINSYGESPRALARMVNRAQREGGY